MMKYAKVTVEIAVDEWDTPIHVVDDLITYALGRGIHEDIGLGRVELIEEKPMAVDEDGTPIWASVREGE